MLQAVITRLMHPEVISIRYFWYRFAIAAVGLAGFFICMTSGIIVSSKNDQISADGGNITGWAARTKTGQIRYNSNDLILCSGSWELIFKSQTVN